ncbi:phage tail spike protein [Paucisalibacillus globulus]|uniref:phage tail spike protein n=1 Tax=Paucisalibacillus globulus TaxID=351095 RepID=UPI000BB95C89|nr:phage tail spike protein [Paucisalibacillus globulus]
MSKIHIADGQTDKLLGHISFDYLLFNNHERSKQDNLELFPFTTFADMDFSKHLTKRNRIVIPGEDGELREFTIFEVHVDRISKQVEVFTKASYLDIKKAKVIAPHTTAPESAERHAQIALSGTEINVGQVDFKGVRTIVFESYTNPFAYLKRIASEFDLELDFRVVIEKGKLTRYADLVERVGMWRGRTVELGRDLLELKRIEKTDDIVTALRVVGPEREDGTRLEVLVEDKEALERWGRNGQHLIDVYEPISTDQDITKARLRQLGEAELKKRINASVSYVGGIADLENVEGMENKKIRYGDTIRIKDTSYDPYLYLEARVHKQNRDIKVKGQKHIELGDYIEYTEDEVKAMWKSLQADIRNKISEAEQRNQAFVEDYAEKIIPEQDTPPNPTEHPKWIDTSGAIPQMKLWDEINTQWTTVKGEKGEPGEQGEQGPKGEDGYTPIKGVDYFDGVDGQDGNSSYLWVRYSQNADGSNMVTDPTGALYIGVATTSTPSAPTSNTSYQWSKYKGEDGIPGEPGSDGRSSYLHIKYSNDGGNTFTAMAGKTVGDWIGTYVDFNQADSTNVSSYTWNKVKGDRGEKGDTGPKGDPGPQGPAGKDGIAYMGQTAPSNPATNSTWFQTNSSDEVIAIKKWNGSTWVTNPMTADVLNVLKLSALSADLGNVNAGHLQGVTMDLGNGKFIVDENGNIIFAGNLDGASGTFSGELIVSNIGSTVIIKDGYILNVTNPLDIINSDRSYLQDGYLLVRKPGDRKFTEYQQDAIAHNDLDSVEKFRFRSNMGFVFEEDLELEGDLIINGSKIIERGSNSNGEYIRFADGTQICRRKWTWPTLAITTAIGPLFRSATITWDFPAAFIDEGVVATSNIHRFGNLWSVSSSESTSRFSAGQRVMSTASASYSNVELSLLAIGRWKL